MIPQTELDNKIYTIIMTQLKELLLELCFIKYEIYKDEKKAIEKITKLQDKLMLLITQNQ